MKCRYCNIALAPSRIFVDGDFCCDNHRLRFDLEGAVGGRSAEAGPKPFSVLRRKLASSSEVPKENGVDATECEDLASENLVSEELASEDLASDELVPNDIVDEPELQNTELEMDAESGYCDENPEEISEANSEGAEEEFEPEIAAGMQESEEPAGDVEETEPELAAAYETIDADDEVANAAVEEELYTEPAYQAQSDSTYLVENVQEEENVEENAEPVEVASEPVTYPSHSSLHQAAAIWQWLHVTWKLTPRDAKLAGLMLPVVLMIAITGSVPKVRVDELTPRNIGEMQGQVQKVVVDHWKNLNQTISDRAAVAFADDFRSGLDAWESHSNLTRSWSYDATGFVRPGPLAVFKPSVDLADYRFEFLGEIDQRALGWAFRAEDLNNYYAMKLVVVKPGPLPLVHIVRYAVINGKEESHIEKPLPLTVRADMLYRVQVDVRGGDFTVMAQGQVVDFWSDSRLQHGGIGFFCNRGERARLRWVEVSHQYDALGRLCAYLAPYGIEGRNGSIN